MRVILYTGKGGVGKTTSSAATGVHLAAAGVSTLVVSADPAHSLGDVLDGHLSPEPQSVAPHLDAVEIDAQEELGRHWGALRDYLFTLFRSQGLDEVLAEEFALIPGAEELATLVAVDEWARASQYEAIVVDCGPTDSTLRLVTLPEVSDSALRILLRIQRAMATLLKPLASRVVPAPLPTGEVFRDAERMLYETLDRIRARLVDPQTTARLVLTPERMVIDEARRAYRDLSLFEVRCDAVVMNRFFPDAVADEVFFQDWLHVQRERMKEVESFFAPLPVLTGPLQADEIVGLAALSAHGQALFDGADPAAILGVSGALRLEPSQRGYRLKMPLPGVAADELDVVVVDDELHVSAGDRRRALFLPDTLSGATIRRARMEGNDLLIEFASSPSPQARPR